jgi:hypothetical protein
VVKQVSDVFIAMNCVYDAEMFKDACAPLAASVTQLPDNIRSALDRKTIDKAIFGAANLGFNNTSDQANSSLASDPASSLIKENYARIYTTVQGKLKDWADPLTWEQARLKLDSVFETLCGSSVGSRNFVLK